jgi:arsenite methyltransferase
VAVGAGGYHHGLHRLRALHLSRGKFVVWAELLGELKLRGNERILDPGCGCGAVLLMAAQQLTTGRAVGVDPWRKAANRAGQHSKTLSRRKWPIVWSRYTADTTMLPFEDGSWWRPNLAIHNIKGEPTGTAQSWGPCGPKY